MTDAFIVPGTLNFRDVGGLPAAGGRTRRGVLFRSGDLARMTPEGAAALRAVGLRQVIDLRTDAEVSRSPARGLAEDVRVTRVPLFAGSAESFFEADATLAQMYRTVVEDSAPALVSVVRGILESSPVLVHCAIGKDRTGVAIAVTLAAAGVSEDAVVADYARTEALLPPGYGASALRWARMSYPHAVNVESLMTRSPATEMRALLDHLIERHGTVERYLRDAGLTADELTGLRRLLIDDEGSESR